MPADTVSSSARLARWSERNHDDYPAKIYLWNSCSKVLQPSKYRAYDRVQGAFLERERNSPWVANQREFQAWPNPHRANNLHRTDRRINHDITHKKTNSIPRHSLWSWGDRTLPESAWAYPELPSRAVVNGATQIMTKIINGHPMKFHLDSRLTKLEQNFKRLQILQDDLLEKFNGEFPPIWKD